MMSAAACNTFTIQNMIHAGMDINARQNKGVTALHIAAYKGYDELVNLTIKIPCKR